MIIAIATMKRTRTRTRTPHLVFLHLHLHLVLAPYLWFFFFIPLMSDGLKHTDTRYINTHYTNTHYTNTNTNTHYTNTHYRTHKRTTSHFQVFARMRPVDLVIHDNNGTVDLRTAVLRYEMPLRLQASPSPNNIATGSQRTCNVNVDLYSLLHIADLRYFEQIRNLTESYDVCLYELITDEMNTKCDGFKRQLARDIVMGAQTTQLAKSLNLHTQMALYNDLPSLPNWYIADLESNVLRDYDDLNRNKLSLGYIQSLIGGRSGSQQLMSSFFLPDRPFITALRILSFLVPCPELSCLVIDWARMNPQAGGVPKILGPLFESALTGRLENAKKLAFAQQIVAGLPDDGSWGGLAKSDTGIRISARNSEVCRILMSFVEEFKSSKDIGSTTKETPDTLKVCILYGAYHINDLSRRLELSGFTRVPSKSPAALPMLTAWQVRSNSPLPTAAGLQLGAFALLVVGYLTFGALDWYLLLRVLIEGMPALLPPEVMANLWSPPLVVAYVALYCQRHLALLNSLSAVGIQWDRGLFEDL